MVHACWFVRDRARRLNHRRYHARGPKTTTVPLAGYRTIVVLYAFLGVLLLFFFNRLTSAAEVSMHNGPDIPAGLAKFFGIGHSHGVVIRLSWLLLLTLSAAASSFKVSPRIGSISVLV